MTAPRRSLSPLLRGALAVAAFSLAPLAAAQEQPESQIVVTGKRNIEQEVADFVAALGPSRSQESLARFETEVCPAAAGLLPSQKAALVDRLRRVAQAADIPVAKPGCRANVVVLVTRDKRALIQKLVNRHPQYLGDLTGPQIRRLIATPGPAAAWHTKGPPRTSDGVDLSQDSFEGKAGGFYVNRTTSRAGRATLPVRPQFGTAIVVIESDALVGLTTTQVADYAAMRAYLRVDPQALAESPTSTILKVLEAPMNSEVPLTLTRWDLGTLRAYYGSPVNLRGGAQRANIRRSLSETLASPEAQP